MSRHPRGRARPSVAIITPYNAASNTGNWHTAARWARYLGPRFNVRVETHWDGAPADCLIALHARRSAASVRGFAAVFPERPCILVLTGTDLYRDITSDRDAQEALVLASRLVVLNELGSRQLPRPLRPKTEVILQSAQRLAPGQPLTRTFVVAVAGHLRAEKDPQLVWRLLEDWPADVALRVLHAGGALDPALGQRAREVAAADRRYRWLGDVPRAQARQVMRNAHVLLHPSLMEGGAQAVIEAITAGTPVIASRIDGNRGLLGSDYPGLFPTGNADAARRLLLRAARDLSYLQRLRRLTAKRAPLFSPQRERRLVQRLVDNCLRG